MMGHDFFTLIQEKVKMKDYIISLHAAGEAEKDDIELHEILEALLTGTVIEEYPSDPRGHSCLAHGCCAGRNLHVCCGMRGSRAAIITVYIPDPEKWIDFTKRRRP
jgi:hypothetical protein